MMYFLGGVLYGIISSVFFVHLLLLCIVFLGERGVLTELTEKEHIETLLFDLLDIFKWRTTGYVVLALLWPGLVVIMAVISISCRGACYDDLRGSHKKILNYLLGGFGKIRL